MVLRSGNKVGAKLGESDGGPALPEEVAIRAVLDCRFEIADCGFKSKVSGFRCQRTKMTSR